MPTPFIRPLGLALACLATAVSAAADSQRITCKFGPPVTKGLYKGTPYTYLVDGVLTDGVMRVDAISDGLEQLSGYDGADAIDRVTKAKVGYDWSMSDGYYPPTATKEQASYEDDAEKRPLVAGSKAARGRTKYPFLFMVEGCAFRADLYIPQIAGSAKQVPATYVVEATEYCDIGFDSESSSLKIHGRDRQGQSLAGSCVVSAK